VNSLYTPIHELLKKTRMLFPEAKIHFQSVIPMGYEYRWTASNVLAFNKLIKRCTREMGCDYIIIFHQFLTPWYHPAKALFNDLLHPSPKGTGIIARALIGIARF
jgi:lysophospholipase L1-like esterase